MLQKAKGLMARRNSPASKLSRALSTKYVAAVARPAEDGPQGPQAPVVVVLGGTGGGLAPGGGGLAPQPAEALANGDATRLSPKLRQFIMEAPAQFTTVRPI